MPQIKSAKKRVKVAAKKAVANKAIETNADNKEAVVKDAVKRIDKAAAKNILHKNTAARKKSSLASKLNKA